MEAPKCRTCGERHFGLCQSAKAVVVERKAHYRAGVAPKIIGATLVKTPDPMASPRLKAAVRRIENALPAPLPASHTFDRKAYQRDYMRKYMRQRRADGSDNPAGDFADAAKEVMAMIKKIRASGLALPPTVGPLMDKLYNMLKEYPGDD